MYFGLFMVATLLLPGLFLFQLSQLMLVLHTLVFNHIDNYLLLMLNFYPLFSGLSYRETL